LRPIATDAILISAIEKLPQPPGQREMLLGAPRGTTTRRESDRDSTRDDIKSDRQAVPDRNFVGGKAQPSGAGRPFAVSSDPKTLFQFLSPDGRQ
jgi:hypothetical protein